MRRERYIMWDTSRGCYRVEMRTRPHYSVCKRVPTLDAARCMVGQLLAQRGERQEPVAGKREVFYDSDPDDVVPRVRIYHRKHYEAMGAPEWVLRKFVVAFD